MCNLQKSTYLNRFIHLTNNLELPAKRIKSFKWKLPTATLVIALAASSAATANDLYLIIGQSNAAGRDTTFRSSGADAPDSNVRLFTDRNNFETASQPLNRYSNVRNTNQDQGVNLGLEFGKEMHDNNGRSVHLVVNARGGTKIAEWRERNQLFGRTVQRVKDAESACNCRLTGIIWHQGEGNISSSSGTFTSSYFNSLEGLIEEFRDEFGDVPFIVGEVARKTRNRSFNRAIRTVDDRSFGTSDVEWARSANLVTFDGTHFDSRSMRTLGRRYASRMQQFID